MPERVSMVVLRHRTAISRDRLSVAAQAALEDGLLELGEVLDYGCGRGQDVQHLVQFGVRAHGWDPHFQPDGPRRPHDAVLLTYVLNTVEDTGERVRVLADAWSMTRRALVVTTRLQADRGRVRGQSYADGILTSRSTFQRLFTSRELRELVESVVGRSSVVARPGVVYAFRDEVDRMSYLAQRYDLTESTAVTDLEQALAFYEERGRLPTTTDGVVARDATAYARALRRTAREDRVAAGRKATTLRLLLFLAMQRFHGPVAWRDLSAPLQDDVRACFGSFTHATFRANRLLHQLRDDVIVRRTMRASPGKLTPSALYVHRRALASCPVLLRIYEECGALAAGRPEAWDIVKLHHDRRMVSWLAYPDFDRDAHPALYATDHVDLTTLAAGHRSYADVANPPVLHRKEEFLTRDDPRYGLYERLTKAEVRAGLYENTQLIGTRDGWGAELDRCGRAVRGHRLVRVSPPAPASR